MLKTISKLDFSEIKHFLVFEYEKANQATDWKKHCVPQRTWHKHTDHQENPKSFQSVMPLHPVRMANI